VSWLEEAAMTNLEKAQGFLSKVFNGADARIEPLSHELAKMFDQAEEEGKVKYQTELLGEENDDKLATDEQRAKDRSPQEADDEPVKHGAPPKRETHTPHKKK
jgi:hypothetical protein